MKQTVRDVVAGELNLEYFAKRLGEGWKVSSIEWSRELSEATTPAEAQNILEEREAIPYGFRLREGGIVEENPLEATVLLLILDQIVKEKRVQEIAIELNMQGYATRESKPWSATDVFNLLPRLIETGPSLLKSSSWQQRRPATQRSVQKTN